MRPGTIGPAELERVVLVEENGNVAVDTTDRPLPQDVTARAAEQGAPVMHEDDPVAWVLVGSMIDSSFDPQQERFLASVRTGVIVSAGAVSLIALLFGSLFLAGLIRPLRQLTAAAVTHAHSRSRLVSVCFGLLVRELLLSPRTAAVGDACADAVREAARYLRELASEGRLPANHRLLCFRVKRRLGALRGRWC